MFDLLVRGGMVIDGTGSPARRADVGIRNGRIEAVGVLPNAQAREVIDAEGRCVCPGFIDAHTHTELALLRNPAYPAHVAQGVTTDVTGMCGLSIAPSTAESLPVLSEYLAPILGECRLGTRGVTVAALLDQLDRNASVNVAYLVPHATLRVNVAGMSDRAPTEEELGAMCRVLEEALEQGALGLSVGLTYFPTHKTRADELVRLCEVVARRGGILSAHLRNYSNALGAALDEVIDTGRRTGVRVHVAHFRLVGSAAGRAGEFLARIDRARAEGVDVTFDFYPYLYGCTLLACFFMPPRFFEGGPDKSTARLADPQEHLRLRRESSEADWEHLTVCAVNTDENQRWVGKTAADMARALGLDPFEACCRLLGEERLRVAAIGGGSREADLREVLPHAAGMLGSDTVPVGSRPHPRAYGAFVRFLSVYARDLKLVSIGEAVRKMTSLPAKTFGLTGRGVVHPGAAADIVVVNLEALADAATYDDPCRGPRGVDCVLVDGRVVMRAGQHTGNLPGRALRASRRNN